MTIRSACLKFVDLIWKILAWSIIFLAVLISLAKLTIGNLQRYQPEIEHWLSEYSGIDVKTQTLQFGWRRYGPTLLIKNAEIQEADRQFHITIGRGFVVLDLFRSLWLGRPVAHQIEFQNVQARLNGQLAVTGENKLSGNQLLNWLLEQGDIQVYDTYVLLTHQQKKFTFATRALHYHGGQSRRALKTTILLTEQGKIDIRGRFFHRDTMTGDLYLRAHQVELAKLPLDLVFAQPHRIRGRLSGQFWASWQGNVASGTGHLSIATLSAHDAEPVSLAPFWFLWKKEHRDRWQFMTSPVQLQWKDTQLTPFTINAFAWDTPDGVHHRHISGLSAPLELLSAWAWPWLPEPLRQKLKDNPIQGQLAQSSFQLSTTPKGQTDWQSAFRVDGLTVSDTLFGVGFGKAAMTGSLSPTNIRFQLSGHNMTISIPKLFQNKQAADHLQAQIHLTKDETGAWWLQWPTLQLATPMFTLSSRGALMPTPTPWLQTSLSLASVDLGDVASQLPAQGMSPKLVSYLTRSIRSGHMDKITAVFRGPLADFPFRQHEGIFHAHAKLKNVVMKFSPDWPEIRELNTDIDFTSTQMRIGPASGKLRKVPVDQLFAQIDDLTLDDPILSIRALSHHSLSDGLQLLAHSPIRNVSKKLKPLALDGSATTHLSLTIPLSPQPNAVTGKVLIQDASMAVPTVQKTHVQNLSGTIEFDNNGLTSGQLSGLWLDAPLRLELAQKSNTLVANFATGLTPKTVVAITNNPAFAKVLHGRADAQGVLQVTTHPKSDQIKVHITSDLVGLGIALPKPWQKTAKDKWPTEITTTIDADMTHLSGHIHNRLDADVSFTEHGTTDGMIRIGRKTTEPANNSGLNVIISLNELLLDQWLRHVVQFTPQNASKLKTDVHLDVDVDQVHVGTTNLGQFNLQGRYIPSTYNWQLQLNSSLAQGTLFIPSRPNSTRPMDIVLDQLYIPDDLFAGQTRNAGKQSAIPQIPPAKITIKKLIAGKVDFGRWSTELKNVSAHMIRGDVIGQLPVGDEIVARIYWNPFGTTTYGIWKSPKVENTLKLFGLPAGLIAQHGRLEVSAYWPTPPWTLATDKVQLTGALSTRSGHIEEVSDSAARVFSLFSLQSLQRRLTLDFSDVFNKGFFFDDIQGQFYLLNGRLYSPQFKVNGTAADVTIKGNVDLMAKTIDQRITVKPKLTSSLPVLAGWAVNPAAAVMAYLLNKLFIRPALDVVTRIDYQVSGTLTSPVIKELGKEKTRVEVAKEKDE